MAFRPGDKIRIMVEAVYQADTTVFDPAYSFSYPTSGGDVYFSIPKAAVKSADLLDLREPDFPVGTTIVNRTTQVPLYVRTPVGWYSFANTSPIDWVTLRNIFRDDPTMKVIRP